MKLKYAGSLEEHLLQPSPDLLPSHSSKAFASTHDHTLTDTRRPAIVYTFTKTISGTTRALGIESSYAAWLQSLLVRAWHHVVFWRRVQSLESNPQLSFATRMEDGTCLGQHKRHCPHGPSGHRPLRPAVFSGLCQEIILRPHRSSRTLCIILVVSRKSWSYLRWKKQTYEARGGRPIPQ